MKTNNYTKVGLVFYSYILYLSIYLYLYILVMWTIQCSRLIHWLQSYLIFEFSVAFHLALSIAWLLCGIQIVRVFWLLWSCSSISGGCLTAWNSCQLWDTYLKHKQGHMVYCPGNDRTLTGVIRVQFWWTSQKKRIIVSLCTCSFDNKLNQPRKWITVSLTIPVHLMTKLNFSEKESLSSDDKVKLPRWQVPDGRLVFFFLEAESPSRCIPVYPLTSCTDYPANESPSCCIYAPTRSSDPVHLPKRVLIAILLPDGVIFSADLVVSTFSTRSRPLVPLLLFARETRLEMKWSLSLAILLCFFFTAVGHLWGGNCKVCESESALCVLAVLWPWFTAGGVVKRISNELVQGPPKGLHYGDQGCLGSGNNWTTAPGCCFARPFACILF